MSQAVKELVAGAALIALAIVAAVYVSERINLRQACDASMAEVFKLVRSMHQ